MTSHTFFLVHFKTNSIVGLYFDGDVVKPQKKLAVHRSGGCCGMTFGGRGTHGLRLVYLATVVGVGCTRAQNGVDPQEQLFGDKTCGK